MSKQSESLKKRWKENYDEMKIKCSHPGFKHSEETKNKIKNKVTKELIYSTCKHCQKIFNGKPWQMKNRFFCSTKCSNKHNFRLGRKHTEEEKIKISKAVTKEKIKMVCKRCDKDFFVKPSQSNRQFCSIKCSNSGIFNSMFNNGHKISLEKNGRWHGGLSFGKYGLEFNEELKEKIRERDERKCQICGISEKEHLEKHQERLSVHHMDYIKTNNSECNLISLCRICHCITNENRENWIEYFIPFRLNFLKKKYGRISIHICSKDRATEIFGLLQSLRTNTYDLFDIVVLDDNYGNPLTNFHFFNSIVTRLKLEGHGVQLIRNNVSLGVCAARNKLIEEDMFKDNDLICRLDDDVLLEPDYLQKLIEVIDAGYDLASGVTPLLGMPIVKREVRFVEPIINKHSLDSEGNLIEAKDDCGFAYLEEKILPTHQFRSNALMKREIINLGIRYPSNLTRIGFREELWFSFQCIIKGFKLGVHTGASALHMQASSGGCRSPTYIQDVQLDEQTTREWIKKQFNKYGDFLNERIYLVKK